MPNKLPADQDVLWNAVMHRDQTFNGKFFFGVITTGVYCRPSCSSRLPMRQNVRFFADAAEAERAGLRACKRCGPNEAELLFALADLLRSRSEQDWRLAELAARAGLSPFHLQRRFKAVIGVTPRQFIEACRLEKLKTQLRVDTSVTEAIYEAGFQSASRVYEKIDTHLGMTPTQYRSGGKATVISYASAESGLGRLMIGATDRGICFIQFGEADSDLLRLLEAEYPAAQLQPMPAGSEDQFQIWMAKLQSHLEGNQLPLDLALDLRATAFQQKVWRYLQTISYGSVKSYSEVAAGLGQPKAARAVARACATNKVALVIPCHRVIRGNGETSGYKWGLHRKQMLLDREAGRAAVTDKVKSRAASLPVTATGDSDHITASTVQS